MIYYFKHLCMPETCDYVGEKIGNTYSQYNFSSWKNNKAICKHTKIQWISNSQHRFVKNKLCLINLMFFSLLSMREIVTVMRFFLIYCLVSFCKHSRETRSAQQDCSHVLVSLRLHFRDQCKEVNVFGLCRQGYEREDPQTQLQKHPVLNNCADVL